MAGYINILEQLMCLEEFMKTSREKGIRRADLPAIKYYPCVLLDTIKQVVNRQTGDGFDTIKFHLIVHMVSLDIYRYASPANISGSAGECQFKDNFKLCASTSQLRDLKFDEQLYNRRHQHLFIIRCAQRVKRADALAQHILFDNSSGTKGTATSQNDFTSELFKRVTNNLPDKERDIAATRFTSSLSCPLYMVQMVKDANDPEGYFEPNIVHCGRAGTTRYNLFYNANIQLVGVDGKLAGTKNNKALVGFNIKFTPLSNILNTCSWKIQR